MKVYFLSNQKQPSISTIALAVTLVTGRIIIFVGAVRTSVKKGAAPKKVKVKKDVKSKVAAKKWL